MPALLLIALATFISEDLTCIATGVLIAQGKLGFWSGTAACLAGIYAGDLALFAAGRLLGRAALSSALFRKFVSPAKVDRASEWLAARGLVVIFLSRFTPGLRLPTYFVAGLLKTEFARFAIWFLAAAAIWTPLLVGLTTVLGEKSRLYANVFAVALFAAWKLGLQLRARRRLVGFLKRKFRWEFWPAWAAYLPVLPYILYLGLKHRSLTLFTAANPGISSGGFVGESKSGILDYLSRVDGAVPAYRLVRDAREARQFMRERGLEFPVVLKPDVGERGAGVAIIRTDRELEERLRNTAEPVILQQYAAGLEFGVFYFRYPNEPKGRILSITEKRFPELTGDGRHSLDELILRDSRAVCLAAAYARAARRPLHDRPAAGERIQLVEIGSHCRGAIFLDGSHLKTEALESAVDRISQTHPGFYFGRYDVRTPSLADFQAGRFQVIELNGVSAEATHIYDPAVSLLEAYRVLFRHWRLAFAIGDINRAHGAEPMTVTALLRLVTRRKAEEGGSYVGTIQVVD